jgi:hypothetical protein
VPGESVYDEAMRAVAMIVVAGALFGCGSEPPDRPWRLEPAAVSPVDGLPKVNGLALADLNGDGRLDIAAVNGDPGHLLILLNQGDDGFAPAAGGRIQVGAGASGLGTGDINGDGNDDIVVSNHDAWTVAVILSNGDGTFAPIRRVPAALRDPGAVAHVHNFALADVNADRRLDIVLAQAEENSVICALGDGAGGFSPVRATLSTGDHPYTIVVADFDGDGFLDAAAPNADSNDLTIGLGDGSGRFVAPGAGRAALTSRTLGLAAGDVNGDGRIDLVSNSDDVQRELALLLGDGRGGFTRSERSFSARARVYGQTIADINGDAMPDVIAPCIDRQSVILWLAEDPRSLRFRRTEVATTGVDSQVMALGDIDGDGDLDVVTAGWNEQEIAVLLGHSSR